MMNLKINLKLLKKKKTEKIMSKYINLIIISKNMSKYDNKIKEMNLYDSLHKITENSDYKVKENFKFNNDINKSELLIKYLSDNKIDQLLLEYEMENYEFDKKEYTLNEFKDYTIKLINRYHHKAGGFLIEDSKWTEHTNLSNKYSINKNEIWFENSIDTIDSKDRNIIIFMNRLNRCLNNSCSNLTIKHIYRESKKDNITWIIIKIIDN